VPFYDMFSEYIPTISSYREQTGRKIFAFTCDCLPFEVIAAFNATPLKIPFTCAQTDQHTTAFSTTDIPAPLPYDLVVYHENCPVRPSIHDIQNIPTYCCGTFHGYGEDASIELHELLGTLLRENDLGDIELLQNESLQNAASPIDAVRKLVRGICGLRRDKPDLLSNKDLFTVLDAAVCFPPELVQNKLQILLDAMNNEPSRCQDTHIPVLINGWSFLDFSLLDDIEDEGLIIIEDDICGGRRQFDLSFNLASGYLYYEILNSFSYKPLCPSIRPSKERYDLLYTLLRNHGIYTVLFLPGPDDNIRSHRLSFSEKNSCGPELILLLPIQIIFFMWPENMRVIHYSKNAFAHITRRYRHYQPCTQ
ncbi:MAG TPA: 2-hydroxyacyl-CoA dehydratase family protein, partial [Spirochaetota bacterium]|nr:2-hydroxyacyl-CoA dehydratase family protein [Spirochaetota bacterium]